uniref:ATP synthase CF0 B chain (Subunit I) n=1 Tax=Prototheca wickerhamii TaxID=3111 RepID=O99014_PROWI|nr:ATP synthase CF0 B subunit [Prototheca wickerhamii]CAB38452.1 ATP synthase CF0 B chain (subunit I) [Prototheca wickerhamii]
MDINAPFVVDNNFAINTNIIETNLLNLAVVIALVFFYVGGTLNELLIDRKKIILMNFQEANQRALRAKEGVDQAKIKFEVIKKQALKIRHKASITIQYEKEKVGHGISEDLKILKNLKESAYKLEQKKIKNHLSTRLIQLSLNKVKDKIKLRLNSSNHNILNHLQIILFTNCKKA